MGYTTPSHKLIVSLTMSNAFVTLHLLQMSPPSATVIAACLRSDNFCRDPMLYVGSSLNEGFVLKVLLIRALYYIWDLKGGP